MQANGAKGISTDANRRRLIHRAKMKSLRISVVIVATFIIWWTPYYVMMIIFMFLNPDKQMSQELQDGIFCFGMSNSLVNPLIYGAFHLYRPKQDIRTSTLYFHRDSSLSRQRSLMTNMSFGSRVNSRMSTKNANRTNSVLRHQEEQGLLGII